MYPTSIPLPSIRGWTAELRAALFPFRLVTSLELQQHHSGVTQHSHSSDSPTVISVPAPGNDPFLFIKSWAFKRKLLLPWLCHRKNSTKLHFVAPMDAGPRGKCQQ